MPKVRKESLPYITAAGLDRRVPCRRFGWLDKNDDFAGLIRIDDYTAFFRCFFIGDDLRGRAGVGEVRATQPQAPR